MCKNDWWGATPIPKILDQNDRVGAKSRIFDLFWLIALVWKLSRTKL